MRYHQITSEERYMIAALRWQGHSYSEVSRQLGRHRSTILREVKRNQCNDRDYRAFKADSRTLDPIRNYVFVSHTIPLKGRSRYGKEEIGIVQG